MLSRVVQNVGKLNTTHARDMALVNVRVHDLGELTKNISKNSQDDGDNLVRGSDLRNTLDAGWVGPVLQPVRMKWTDGTHIYVGVLWRSPLFLLAGLGHCALGGSCTHCVYHLAPTLPRVQ